MASSKEIIKPISASKQRRSIGQTIEREKKSLTLTKKCTRVTVVNPRLIDWPDNIDDSSLAELRNCIKETVSILKFPRHKVPLNEIRVVDKAKRHEFRQQWQAKHMIDTGFDVQNYVQLRSNITIGVNCVSRALEISNDELLGVIIEKNVSPAIITKLLVPIALGKNVPIIAIDGLNEICMEHFRIRCNALGLKKCCEKISNHFHPLLVMIKKYGKQYLEESQVMEDTTDIIIKSESDILETAETTHIIPAEVSISGIVEISDSSSVDVIEEFTSPSSSFLDLSNNSNSDSNKKGVKRRSTKASFKSAKIRKT